MANLLDEASILLSATSYNNGSMLAVKPENGDGDFTFSRNSAATRVNAQGLVENVQILSSNLVSNGDFSQEGSELITNGDFSSDTDWTLGTGWTISGGTANYDGLQAYQLLRQGTTNGVIGKTYLVKYDVSNNNGTGGIIAKFGGVNLSSYNSDNGSFEFYVEAISTDYIRFTPQLDFSGSIDNVSVKEVGQDWNSEQGIWTFGDSVVNGNGANGATQELTQFAVTTVGKNYNITYEVLNYVSGSVQVLGSEIGYVSSNGVYTSYYSAASTTFKFRPINFIGSITNISILEITNDTNLPRINYEGFSYQDSLGSEEVVNGDFATDLSGWFVTDGAAGIDITWTANGVSFITDGAGGGIQQSVMTVGKSYLIEFDYTAVSGAIKMLPYFTDISETKRYSEYVVATTTNIAFYRKIGGTEGIIDNVSVKEVLGQEVVPNSGCGSWLLEPQSTNLITQSENFSDASWNLKSEISILSNNGVSPDGTLNADKIIPSTINATHYIGASSQQISGHNYSVFVKSDGYDWILLTSHVTSAVGTRGTYFNINNGTIGTIGSAGQNPKIENYGNGWYRCSIDEGDAPSSLFGVFVVNQDNATNFQGDGVSGVYLWGAEREAGSYPTSYIPTTQGAISTRLQDIATNSGNASLINSEEGTLYVDTKASVHNGNITLSDGSNNNNLIISFNLSSGRIDCNMKADGAYQFIFNHTTDMSINHKIAVRYKANDFALFVNGIKVLTDTSGITPSINSLNKINFSSANTASNFFYGKTKAVAVYKTALTDAQLTLLTTI